MDPITTESHWIFSCEADKSALTSSKMNDNVIKAGAAG